MFLKPDGQPIIFREQSNLYKQITDADLELMKDSTMMLSSIKALIVNKSLKNWCGQIYSSEAIYRKVLDNFIGLKDLVCAEKTKIYNTTLKSGKRVSIRIIPIGENNSENNVLFIIHDLDEDLTSVCIDIFDGYYDAFIFNKELQNVLCDGVDTLYIDDSCFLPDLKEKQNLITKEHFQNLVTLIKPKRIFGLVGAILPNYIENILLYTKNK